MRTLKAGPQPGWHSRNDMSPRKIRSCSALTGFGNTTLKLWVGDGSHLIGKNLIDSHLRQDNGVIIVAIKRDSGEMVFNPMPAETLNAGDVIVVIGKKEDLVRMSEIL